MKVWKLSHGYKEIPQEQSDWLDKNSYLTIHENTKKSQGQYFINQVKVGDIVSLSRSGDLKALVRVTSDILIIKDAPFNNGWVFRKYEIIQELSSLSSYSGEKKGWTPTYNGTLFEVPKSEWELLEAWILKKYYQCTLESIGVKGASMNSDQQYQWIKKCKASSFFDKFLMKKGLNKNILNDAIRVIHEAAPKFDLYNINKTSSALRFGNKESAQKAGKVAGMFMFEKGQLNIFFSKRYDREESKRITLTDDTKANEALIIEALAQQLTTFQEHGLCGNSRWPTFYGEAESLKADLSCDEDSLCDHIPLNQILYGPPGTGKTYHTIEAAVKAAEPLLYDFINTEPVEPNDLTVREKLENAYKSLVAKGQIRFVTFHQSYGYEDFVIGLTARTKGEQITYFEKDGVFKEICDDAKTFRETTTTKSSESFVTCWQAFVEKFNELETGIEIKTVSGKSSINVYDIENDIIRFDKKVGKSVHSLNVKTLKAIFYKERVIKGGLEPYYAAMIKYIKALADNTSDTHIDRKNYVLIIDEINRGNISKIFGELITLIEPSKRLGAKDELEAILPNSEEPFSVPDNLYLIGTMNTADRSLAMMDTALRRRFDFVEMMPDYRVLNDEDGMPYCIDIDGIKVNIPKLLSTMNERIEVLYDRDHTLGHAFFMPVLDALNSGEKNSDVKAFSELQRIFKNKIIPLLEEYFFEDWNKIRLVLGDNQKATTSSEVNKKLEKMMFVQATMKKYSSFFGDNHGLDAYENEKTIYKLASFTDENSPWKNEALYQAIYDEEKLKAIIKNTENSVKTQKEAEQNKQQEAQGAKESVSESEGVI